MQTAAAVIHDLGCGAVLIKGGHWPGEAVDVLYDGETYRAYSSKRIDSIHTHGTGCTLSAAILACLVRGEPLEVAVRIAKAYVTEAIRRGLPLGKGHGPLDHSVRVPGMENT
jgi:hydroxymethylpyrimidine/phosphomethylpyrimidine kinase